MSYMLPALNFLVTDEIGSSFRSSTIVWASVGSVVFVFILVALVFIVRRFWCRKVINKLDPKVSQADCKF